MKLSSMADDSSALEEEDALGTTTQTTVQQSIIISNKSEALSNANDGFGKSIPYKPPQQPSTTNRQQLLSSQNQQTIRNDETEILKMNHNRNIIVAISSLLTAILHYIYQYTHPISAVSILLSMQSTSSPLSTIGHNGKPTVIDFWAPWCTNCRYAAPTLQAIEVEYTNRVNFILVNADDPTNYSLIQALGVDAIPHLALVDSAGYVKTALIGPVSRNVLREDLDALLLASTTNNVSLEKGGCGTGRGDDTVITTREKMITTTIATTTMMDTTPAAAATTNKLFCHADLPYKMYDAFENRPEESRHVNFVER
jgi:thiol-disulfide isomerase/thioredoxin